MTPKQPPPKAPCAIPVGPPVYNARKPCRTPARLEFGTGVCEFEPGLLAAQLEESEQLGLADWESPGSRLCRIVGIWSFFGVVQFLFCLSVNRGLIFLF